MFGVWGVLEEYLVVVVILGLIEFDVAGFAAILEAPLEKRGGWH